MEAVNVFFSQVGENFINGKIQDISIGNTAIVAKKISEQLHIPLYELVPIDLYPKNYEERVGQNERSVLFHSLNPNKQREKSSSFGNKLTFKKI